MKKFLLFGDVHYAGPAETRRGLTETEMATSWAQKTLVHFYRNFLWLADPIGHAHQFPQLLDSMNQMRADEAVCLGDLSMDTAFVGLSDPASMESAAELVKLVRHKLDAPTTWLMGDHEIGKTSMIGKQGGPRIASFNRWTQELEFPAWWERSIHHWRLIGVCSTLAAFPVYETEFPQSELSAWKELYQSQLSWLQQCFDSIEPRERIILFCHDPSALGFLHALPEIQKKLSQIAVTWVGHMHTPLVEKAASIFSGVPPITQFGTSIRRFSTALQKAAAWKDFRMRLCPSPSGSELLRDGGYFEMVLHHDASIQSPLSIFHPNPW